MPVYAIALIGVVVTFVPLAVMLLMEKRFRPRQRLWQAFNIIVFIGVVMVFGGLFAAGLATTPSAPPSEFWRW